MENELKVILDKEQASAFIEISDGLSKLHEADIFNLKDDITRMFIEYQGSDQIDFMDKEYRHSMASRVFTLLDALSQLEQPLKNGHHDALGELALNTFK